MAKKRRSRVYWGRAYGDFRDFADVGDVQESLIPSGAKRATTLTVGGSAPLANVAPQPPHCADLGPCAAREGARARFVHRAPRVWRLDRDPAGRALRPAGGAPRLQRGAASSACARGRALCGVALRWTGSRASVPIPRHGRPSPCDGVEVEATRRTKELRPPRRDVHPSLLTASAASPQRGGASSLGRTTVERLPP